MIKAIKFGQWSKICADFIILTAKVSTYLDSAGLPDVQDPLGRWARTGRRIYPRLWRAARGLLLFTAGNAPLGRLSSAAGRALGDKLRQTLDARRLLLLRVNGPVLLDG